MKAIELTETKQVKNPNTKTTYLNESIKVSTITDKQYYLITNDGTVKWFRRLGGSESLQRTYTCAGYKVYKIISTSPDKQDKTIREFKFKSN